MINRLQRVIRKIKKFRRNRSNLNIFLMFAAIVMIWSGIANLLDLYFFPNKPFIGNLVCIALGVIILLLDDGKLEELEGEPEGGEKAKEG